ncbi:MAG: class I SAM-dependent methyltransferase [Acidimicrobiales bacterium]|jgi:cephalosporin hydroxylase|nr:class I SAM-dependent methyltransferase [Acidimicrobiales bacterium]
MFPFWKVAVWPVLQDAEARRIVEIGALRGQTTDLMLEQLGPGAELHVIDPVPAFDPTEHEQKFPGRYVFHRDLSLNVLPTLAPMDAALIDGDHNWYTVYNECRLLAQTARAAGAPLPVLILHDVCWPYGRRDLYYAPETIPAEFRQPHAQQGIRMGKSRLVPVGGLNPQLDNAIEEGGPRNGVMTGLEDFMAEHDKPLRLVLLPIYFGLAIVVEEERLERQPALRKRLDWLEGLRGKQALLHLAEETRLKAMVFQHGIFSQREEQMQRSATRYLNLLKGALLDEHYLENELRLDYLNACLTKNKPVDPGTVREPVRHMRVKAQRLAAARRAGLRADDEGMLPVYFPYTTMGRTRLDHLQRCLDTLRAENVEGDLVDTGVGRGGSSVFLRAYLDAYEQHAPSVWVVDPFRASPAAADDAGDPDQLGGGANFPSLSSDLNDVRNAFARFDLLDARVRFLQGQPYETLPDAPLDAVALLRIGGGESGDPSVVLGTLYDKVTLGGFVVVDHYDDDIAAREAVDGFRTRRGIVDPLERIDGSGVCWRKTVHAPAGTGEQLPAATGNRAPLAPPAPTTPTDLSVVVVFYNMRREAARTLHSLSRSYQEGVEDLDYEVIVVENGSAPDQCLGEELVRSFGPEFRYVDMADQARPSPVFALNRGIELARGENLALMIDGAHVLTPGVLRYGMQGLGFYDPAVVVTQQWYVGPGQQNDMMLAGYDQAAEDRLFEQISWPSDGYRLFDIGHFIGERDWFDGQWESNCVFAPRSLLEQTGGFDESFSVPGGGFANLELYERLAASPEVTLASILGEGSFHQIHGGTTTNQGEIDERQRKLGHYAEQFRAMRGRDFHGPGKNIHYVGSMWQEAMRTKSRRRGAPNWFKRGSPDGADGIPQEPNPVPSELKTEFIEAYWRSLVWRDTAWLGTKVERTPTDLFAYQELLAEVRPDFIVQMRTFNGGEALFLASVCDLLGHGRVISVDEKDTPNLPEHPRLTYVQGSTVSPDTAAQVRALIGEGEPRVLVFLGSRGGRQRVTEEFALYAPLVPTGSYVVVEDTIFNGHPVWPAFGPGPHEAVRLIVNERGEFTSDPAPEKFGLTFNPGGFLKRTR